MAWILVLVLLWVSAGFAILWLLTRKKLRKLEADTSDSGRAEPSQPHAASAPASWVTNESATASLNVQSSEASAAPVSAPDQGKTVFNQVATESPIAATDALPYLEVIEGPDAGSRFNLPYAKSIIGRDYNNEITLSDDGLSRKHCFIEWADSHFRLVDNDSTNGTFCNDKSIAMQVLEFTDVITISDTRMQYTCKAMQIKDQEPAEAIKLLQSCVAVQPDFLTALQHLAYLMERDLRQKKDAAPLWKKISKLEKSLDKQKSKARNLQTSN